MTEKNRDKHLLYYRTIEQIREYRKVPLSQKLEWLQTQMEFYHKAMTARDKQIRDRLMHRGRRESS